MIIIKKCTIVTVKAHAPIIRYKRTPALISGISACAFKRGIRVLTYDVIITFLLYIDQQPSK